MRLARAFFGSGVVVVVACGGCSSSSATSVTNADGGGGAAFDAASADAAAPVDAAADGARACNDLQQLGSPVLENASAGIDAGAPAAIDTLPDGTYALVEWKDSPPSTHPATVRWTLRVAGTQMDSLFEQVGGASQRASWTLAYASGYWHAAPPICGARSDTGYPWDGSGKGNLRAFGDGYVAFGQSVDGASDQYVLRRIP